MARTIFAAVAVVFIGLALVRLMTGNPRTRLQSRIWLLIGVIFGAVSAWLFYAT